MCIIFDLSINQKHRKMKKYNTVNRVSAKAKQEIESIIRMHETYKNSYFWKAGGSAGERRSNEKRFASRYPSVSFITKKGTILVEPSYSESCNNVYYSLSITLDEEKKNITTLKNLIK